MRGLRKAFAIVFTFMMLLCLCSNVFAYTIDGTIKDVDRGDEWFGRQIIDVAGDAQTGSKVEHVLVRYEYQANPAVLYVAIQCIEGKEKIESIEQCGIEIVLNGADFINVAPDAAEYDEDLFYISSAFQKKFDGMDAEMKIGFKDNVGSEIDFRFNVIDSEGNRSRQFELTMQEDKTDETAEQQESSSTKKSGSSSKTATKKKTSGSSKTRTTKRTTAAYSTVNPKDYSTSGKASGAKDTTSVYQTVNVSQTQQGQSNDNRNENGKIVLKTVSVGILAVASIAFVATFLKRKKI